MVMDDKNISRSQVPTMEKGFLDILREFGVGHRNIDDPLFANDKPPPTFGLFDTSEENLCHEKVKTSCNIPGCRFKAETLLEYENHYNGSHRYLCSQCKKVMPSPHLLDLHIQETHDSFFAVLSAKKPSYCCYIQDCKEKFMTTKERMDHCVMVHRLPKDFRFNQSITKPKPRARKKEKLKREQTKMEVDLTTPEIDAESVEVLSALKPKPFLFNNNKQKTFSKYSGKKFTKDSNNVSSTVNFNEVMSELKEHLPS